MSTKGGDMKGKNIERLCDKKTLEGFNVVIVCTSDQSSEDFWQNRLENVEGVLPKTSKIVVVHEDWEGGAGNALGTLYAFQKANAQFLKRKDNKDGQSLLDLMASGAVSVALYHTAGKGTRLAPLPGSENNNKPGVKLPSIVHVNGEQQCVTILESVIRQTGLYASVRKGRLSVFWGDQIFIPTLDTTAKPTHHADILAMLGKFPSPEEWKARGLEKYGLITVNSKGDACQVEKVSHETASKLLDGMGTLIAAGTSLGSFSISCRMVKALLSEFSKELSEKKGKLDTDPHWWMPFTLPRDGYAALMVRKGTSIEDAKTHWMRMKAFAEKHFNDVAHLLGAVDVGSDPYWWDYGQLKYYIGNNLKLTDRTSTESAAMRKFFDVPAPQGDGTHVASTSKLGDDIKVTDGSVILGSKITRGRIKGCVIVNCLIDEIDAENSLLINVVAPKVSVKGGVVYNVAESEKKALDLKDGAVAVDVMLPDESDSKDAYKSLRVHSHASICGGKSWKTKACENDVTFETIYLKNRKGNLCDATKYAKIRRQDSAEKLFS